MQIHRLFEIVYLLLNKPRITARELAQRFEVSERTIYRDVDVLSGAGIPIFAVKGKGGGISLLPDYVLNTSLLTDGEQEAILLGLKSLSATGGDPEMQTLDKLSRLFHKRQADWLEVDFSSWGSGPEEKEKFRLIKTAVRERRVLVFSYDNASGERSERQIEPVRLWFKGNRWYVQGFCHIRQAWRTFKMSRMQEVRVTDRVFESREDTPPALENLDAPPALVELRLRFSPAAAYRVYDTFRREEIQPQEDGRLAVTVWYPEDGWVYGFLLSFGGDVEVLSPPHIRAILRDQAAAVLRLYSE